MDWLGGGLIWTAGPGDHGSVGGLAVKAVWLLGGPHDDFGRRWTLGEKCYDICLYAWIHRTAQAMFQYSTLCSIQASSGCRKQTTVHFSYPPHGETAAEEGAF